MICIERIRDEHLPQIEMIEQECFSSPWTRKSLELLLGAGAVGFCATEQGKVVAYGGMMYVLDEGQITNIATLSDYRRRGFAKKILESLLEFAKQNGLANIFLEVRQSNAGAIDLYRDFGFVQIGQRRNFYTDPAEDAILLKLDVK